MIHQLFSWENGSLLVSDTDEKLVFVTLETKLLQKKYDGEESRFCSFEISIVIPGNTQVFSFKNMCP